MRIMNLVLCDDGKNDKTIRALASDGKLYDIADISKDLFDILVATRIREDLQVDGALQGIEALIPRGKINASTRPIIFVPMISYSIIEPNHQTKEYLKNWLKWVCTNYPNRFDVTFIGPCMPNSTGVAICLIYNTSIVNSEGLPQYACGQYTGVDGPVYTFGTNAYNFYFAQSTHSIPWDSVTGKPSVFPVSQGGTGATTASAALANLGGLPKSYAGLVRLWYGSQGSGTITIPNARLYNSLLFVGSPGSGETLTSLVLGGTFTGSYQLTSNEAYLVLKLSNSGNNTVVQVDASAYNGYLSYVFGIVRTT